MHEWGVLNMQFATARKISCLSNFARSYRILFKILIRKKKYQNWIVQKFFEFLNEIVWCELERSLLPFLFFLRVISHTFVMNY